MGRSCVYGAVALALVGGCSNGPGGVPSVETTARTTSAIQGGTEDTTDSFTVAVFLGRGDGGLCTGVLLAPNLVATARHCVAPTSADAIDCATTTFGAVYPPSQIYVSSESELALGSATITAADVVVPTAAGQERVCGNDIALLVLSQNIVVPQYVEPVLDPPMTDHSAWSTTVTAIGYGEASANGVTGTLGTRRILQDIALRCIPGDTTFTDCYADPVERSTVAADEFEGGDGMCDGDSGSGAFDQAQFDAGRWAAFGVLSRGDANTCTGSVYTRFDRWKSLLIGAAGEAAQLGGYSVPAWAVAPSSDAGAGTGEGGGRKSGCGVARVPTQPVPREIAAGILGAVALVIGRRKRG